MPAPARPFGTDRITDPTRLDPALVERRAAEGLSTTIQFSKPGFTPKLLRELDGLCQRFGTALEVRFYGFYHGQAFDAACLAHLPHVQWLSVDCLTAATSLDALSRLAHLRRLSVGILDLDRPDLLAHLPLEQLTELRLCETRKNLLDLAPLARCRHLERLHLADHTRNFDVLAQLSTVQQLSLRSIPKRQASLAALNSMPSLRDLTVILGGRDHLDELHLPHLTDLAVIWVRGLTALGDLSRFPALRKLRVEDQLRLAALDLAPASPALEHLCVINCKGLRTLGPLQHLSRLHTLRIFKTALDADAFLRAGLPATLKTFHFYTGKKSLDEPLKARLAALGYNQP